MTARSRGRAAARAVAALATAAALTLGTACAAIPDVPFVGGDPDSGPGAGKGAGGAAAVVEPELAARYGEAPDPSPPDVTYQPDVVVVGGGAASVRSVSTDGLFWTLDANADRMADVEVGKIVFLTSRAVGRVASIERNGNDAVVALAPVQFTEVIKDGTFSFDSEVELDEPTVQVIPDAPGAAAEPSPEDIDVPRMGLAPYPGLRQPGILPPPDKGKADVSLGDWGITLAADKKGITTTLAYKVDDNFKLTADVVLGTKSATTLAGEVAVVGGVATANPTMILKGIDYIDLKFAAGVAGGVGDNRKLRAEIPIELANRPVVIGGVPMVVHIKTKLFLETALSGKNSTLTAGGRWQIAGDIGVVAGAATVPGLTVVTSLMDSIGGIAIGPSGLVLGTEWRFMLGFGLPGAMAGPYAKARVTVGVTNGSAFGAPLARCTRGDLIVKFSAGVGATLDSKVIDEIKKRLPKGIPSLKIELEQEWGAPPIERSQTIPDVPLCTGAA